MKRGDSVRSVMVLRCSSGGPVDAVAAWLSLRYWFLAHHFAAAAALVANYPAMASDLVAWTTGCQALL